MEITRTESDLLSVLAFRFIVDRDVPNKLGADVVSVSKSMKNIVVG